MSTPLPHDRALLDSLFVAGKSYDGTVWRITQADRDPLRGSNLPGRWSGGENEVLYTACEMQGALAEIGFRLTLEPIWPSRLKHMLHEISIRCTNVLDLSSLPFLETLGVNAAKYQSLDYAVTSSISAAAAFLEFDAMLVPNARFACNNLVIFSKSTSFLTLLDSTPVDWAAWRTKFGRST